MEGNIELLNYIHQNSEMGRDTIKQLMGIVADSSFKKTLESQHNEYKKIFDLSEEKIKKDDNSQVKGINILSKVSSYIMINVNTLMDKSPSHISEMMIKGSTMGIVDITKKINEHNDADKEILDLANKLLVFEQRNIDELKKFL